MTTIIKDGVITTSDFSVGVEGSGSIVALEDYLSLDLTDNVGVWLDSGDEVEALEGHLDCPVIALSFPAFNDGRAYSAAYILRRHYGYTGELRAIGDVRLDQLEQMVRCGFNAFEMASGQNMDAAQARLAGFTENYQSTADRPEPLFRRR